ncbi:MAG: hypothetical protein AAGD01_07675 [Acidobacteriota bacterium]
MDSRARWLIAALALILIAVLAWWWRSPSSWVGAPTPDSALVAIEVVGEGFGRVGPVQVEAGTETQLHAVLVASGGGDEAMYYTEAPGLEVAGQRIPAERIAPWPGRRPKLRWFSIEGAVPFQQVQSAESVEARFSSIYRPDWPDVWTLPGRVKPSSTSSYRWLYGEDQDAFGTLRYEVRVEFYKRTGDLLPEERYSSPSVESALEDPATFPTLTVALADPLRAATQVFGLAQFEPSAGLSEETSASIRAQVNELAQQRLAFESLTVIADTARSAGLQPADLQWRTVTLEDGTPWATEGSGEGLQPGDFLQIAGRVTVLYQDRGEIGILDPQDLCLDFARGAAVLPLDDVFDVEGDLSLARLGGEP